MYIPNVETESAHVHTIRRERRKNRKKKKAEYLRSIKQRSINIQVFNRSSRAIRLNAIQYGFSPFDRSILISR